MAKNKFLEHDVDNSVQPMSKVGAKKKSTILKEGQRVRSDKKHHYVDNAAFFLAICDYQDRHHAAIAAGTKPPQIPNFIGECILKIAKKLADHPSFSRYTYVDIMVDNAVEACIKAVIKFNRTVSENPFSYFTQSCSYSFLNTLKEEEQEIYVRYKAFLDAITSNLGAGFDTDEDAAQMLVSEVNIDITHVEEFVKRFEDRMERVREKGRERKEAQANDLDILFE